MKIIICLFIVVTLLSLSVANALAKHHGNNGHKKNASVQTSATYVS